MLKNIFSKFAFLVFVSVLVFLPSLVSAQTEAPGCVPNPQNLRDVICKAGEYIGLILPVLLSLGVVYFVWGVVQYVIKDEEEAKKKGKDRIIFGLIGFAVIGGMWGLVQLVIYSFGVDGGGGTVVQDFVEYNKSVVSDRDQSCDSLSGFSGSTLGHLVKYVTCFITDLIIPLIITLAVASFIWGVVQYVINTDDQEKKAKGRDFMIWGIIGLSVMVGVWGLVSILGGTFGIGNAIPQLR